MDSFRFYLFRSPSEIPGLFDSLFGGLFVIKGIPLLGQLGILLLSTGLIAGIATLALDTRRSRRLERWLPAVLEGAMITLFSLLCLFLLQPWDEVFVNLQHAANWENYGIFSFSRTRPICGTVELLSLTIVRLMYRSGIPWLDAIFLQGFFGGLLAWFALRCLSRPNSPRSAASDATRAMILILFPPLAFNASHGFGATWFAAAILWAVWFLVYGPPSKTRRLGGMLLLSSLAWWRFEGVLFTVLLGGYSLWREKRTQSRNFRILALCILILPTVALWALLAKVYGTPVPTPVHFKATLGDIFFFAVGLRNLAADGVATGGWLLLLAGIYLHYRGPKLALTPRVVAALLALFTIAYYSSGGDWFPSYWGRYLLPLNLFALAALVQHTFTHQWIWPPWFRAGLLGATVSATLLTSAWSLASNYKWVELIFSQRRTLARIEEPTIGRGHHRIQFLSQLGRHLRDTASPASKLGTSEVGTLHFFSQLDGYDFLGVANPEIARAPVRTTPQLFRRFPAKPELPSLIFKRRLDGLLERYQPDYLYTFDYNLRDIQLGIPLREFSPATHCTGLARWESKLGGLVEGLYGGLSHIESLGFVPVIVSYGKNFAGFYFVHKRAEAAHFQAMRDLGMTEVHVNCTRLGEQR